MYQGNVSNAVKLKSWAAMHGNIPVQQLDAQKLNDMSSSAIPVVLSFYTNAEEAQNMKQLLRQLAPEFTDVLVFYLVEMAQFQTLGRQFGLHSDTNNVVILYPTKGSHFVMPANITVTIDSLREYLNEYLDDRLQRSLRSEPSPKELFTPGTVQTVVANTLMATIQDTEKDILLELCRPGHPDCSTLANITNHVAALTGSVPSFKTARINVDLNEVGAFFEIPHIPLLLFFAAKNKTALSYTGVAAPSNIMQFVSAHATTPFDVPDVPEDDGEADPNSSGNPEDAPSQQDLNKIEAQAAAHVASTLHALQSNVI